ncbi:MAG: FadR/GntR family transcriptional regulator [Parvibaculales bacterium]
MQSPSKRLTNQIAAKIGRDIAAQRISAGEILPPDTVLSKENGVSRVVMREALRILGAKGMLRAVPKAGTFVSPKTEWAMFDAEVLDWVARETPAEKRRDLLHELLDLRLMFEPGAAALAASRATSELRQSLSDAFQGVRQSGVGLSGRTAELNFFSLLLDGAQNDFLAPLTRVHSLTHELIERIGHRYTRDFDFKPHERLTRAIINHDAASARASMQAVLLSMYVRS